MINKLAQKIQGKQVSIVYPEATDERILKAVSRLYQENLIQPILIGDEEEINIAGRKYGVSVDNMQIYNPNTYADFDSMVEAFVARRNGKTTENQARGILRDKAYFGTMLVYQGIADGMVCGAVYTTGDTVRPALQIIKTREGVQLISGAFLMLNPDNNGENYIMSDCAININPNAQQLAEIAVETAKTAELFGLVPRIAMLSFSSKGSANSPEVDKVVEATKIAQQIAPNLKIDGELQLDAAIVPSVGKSKAKDSEVAGQANVLIFPDLQSGNIGYKIGQRFGNYQAIGPILQGLQKPISDLSRGCNIEDVYNISIVTASQSLQDSKQNNYSHLSEDELKKLIREVIREVFSDLVS
ncbi:phosphate acetyltransferase [Suicoccus acidiformans]|uniref:Phosphate acetyltransferase n=1 Tax=Suicoccus acidiformans TaxID=2036206 RepID=A0A347WLX9_9LACT|nr:phosphate acetyltransferase [Suicoccus acidiformans]AXY26086.1 phosphate acetyltransferase [Suicoccus acidiformans]